MITVTAKGNEINKGKPRRENKMLLNNDQDQILQQYKNLTYMAREMDITARETGRHYDCVSMDNFGRMRSYIFIHKIEDKYRFFVRGDCGRFYYESDLYPNLKGLFGELYDFNTHEYVYLANRDAKYKNRIKNCYEITFEVHKNRVITSYVLHIEAYNAREAKEDAEDLWYQANKSHMFHLNVKRLADTKEFKFNYFHKIDTRFW